MNTPSQLQLNCKQDASQAGSPLGVIRTSCPNNQASGRTQGTYMYFYSSLRWPCKIRTEKLCTWI